MLKPGILFLLALCIFASCKTDTLSPKTHLEISVPYDPDTLDPHASNTISNFATAGQFYEPLVRADANLKIAPALATSWENPDLLTWIFHLQRSAKFHSGKKVEADDVVYSFHRLLTHPELEMRAYLANVIEVKSLDPYSVRVRTSQPVSVFLNKLNFVLIVPRNSNSSFLAAHEDGSGPYRLVDWIPGNRIRLTRNEQYWDQKPSIEFVTFYLNRTPQQSIQDLQSEKSQFIQSNTKMLEKVIGSSNRYQMQVHDSLFVKFLSYDMARDQTPYCSEKTNPFRQKLVRQAIQAAIDQKSLIAKLSTYSVPATQPVPPFVYGYNPEIAPPVHDLVKARALLAQAGYPNGFEVTLHARVILSEAAEIVKKQLADIGIRVNVRALSSPDFYSAMNRRDFSFILTATACPTGDAGNILEGAMHSPNPSAQFGNLNYGGYSNPELDREIEESSGIPQQETRRSRLEKIMSEVMQDLPWIPLYIDQEAYGVADNLQWTPRNDSYVFAREITLHK